MDEDSQARSQLNILRGDGHDVVAVGELEKNGTPDPEIFELAQLLERVLLTHNAEDFHELHRERPEHRGIMAVFRESDPQTGFQSCSLWRNTRRASGQATPSGSGAFCSSAMRWCQLVISTERALSVSSAAGL